jgi:hypothetical protein
VNGTGSVLCEKVVFGISHVHSFVSVTRELVFSCFVHEISVTII